jgi:hypothetical protein
MPMLSGAKITIIVTSYKLRVTRKEEKTDKLRLGNKNELAHFVFRSSCIIFAGMGEIIFNAPYGKNKEK